MAATTFSMNKAYEVLGKAINGHFDYWSGRMAMTYGWTMESMEHHMQKVATQLQLKRLPEWAKYQMQGVWKLYRLMVERNLVWTHVLDGKRIPAKEIPAQRLRDIDKAASAHCLAYLDDAGERHFLPFRRDDRDTDVAAGRLTVLEALGPAPDWKHCNLA